MNRNGLFLSAGAFALLSSACSATAGDVSSDVGHSDVAQSDVAHKAQAAHTTEICASAQLGPNWSWYVPNNLTGTGDVYFSPVGALGTEAAARAFLETLRPQMPLYQPFDDKFGFSEVVVGGGWYYSFDPSTPDVNFHIAIDYSKANVISGEDPSFRVNAIADGTVISVDWVDVFGNFVVIEHTAPDGTRYRSLYIHLRNGATHDCNLSKAIVSPDPSDPNNRETRFQTWMLSQNCGSLDANLWGTDADTITVKPGDEVTAGQFLGWSGATGYGGIGNALDSSGVLGDTVRGNNHLHLFFAVFEPSTSQWVFVDPYGVYNDSSDGCYEVEAETEYARLFAPFYPSFHGVKLSTFSHHINYYPSMGLGLHTASIYRVGAEHFVAGSYRADHAPVWKAEIFLPLAEFQERFDEYYAQNLQLRELTVAIDAAGQPRFSGIWETKTAADWGAWVNMTDAGYEERWQEFVVNGNDRVFDHFAYEVGGQRLHAAIFVRDGVSPWYAPWGYTQNDFDNFADARHQEGMNPISINAEEVSGSLRYGGVFANTGDERILDRALDGFSGYQSRFDELVSQGYRLERIQGYDNGQKFAAIWSKSSVPSWQVGVTYQVGDLVLFEGEVWRVLQPHTSQVGWQPDQAPALFEKPAPSGVAEWQASVTYQVGDVVTYEGAKYEAVLSHTSLAGWEPPNVPALWALVP